jgi:hypothetical protein
VLVRSSSSSDFSLTGDIGATEAPVAVLQPDEVISVAGEARSLKSGSMASGKPAADEHGSCSADGTLCSQATNEQQNDTLKLQSVKTPT